MILWTATTKKDLLEKFNNYPRVRADLYAMNNPLAWLIHVKEYDPTKVDSMQLTRDHKEIQNICVHLESLTLERVQISLLAFIFLFNSEDDLAMAKLAMP